MRIAAAGELSRLQAACQQQVDAAQAAARTQLEGATAKLQLLRMRQRRLMDAVTSVLSEEHQQVLSSMLQE
jgi:hypothetical protein